MKPMGSVNTLMIAIGLDSDVEVVHTQDDVYVITWKNYSVGVFSLPEAVLYLDTVQGQGAKIPWRFMQDIAIEAISNLMENQNDNIKE